MARTEIIGESNFGLGAEEVELAREGGSSEREAVLRRISSSGYSPAGRARHRQRILRRLSRDPAMLTRVQQRAAQGDPRAQRLLAAYQGQATSPTTPYGAQAPYVSPWGAQAPGTVPGTQAPYVSPWSSAPQYQPPVPTPTTNAYYVAPTSYDNPAEYDDYSGLDTLAALLE
jgi:hypothetical protein